MARDTGSRKVSMDHNEKCQCHEYRERNGFIETTLITIMADSSKEGNREDRKKVHQKVKWIVVWKARNAGMLFNPD